MRAFTFALLIAYYSQTLCACYAEPLDAVVIENCEVVYANTGVNVGDIFAHTYLVCDNNVTIAFSQTLLNGGWEIESCWRIPPHENFCTTERASVIREGSGVFAGEFQ